ncbi:MAG TPA: mitochondrial fission ELM1 family protein [Caulobacteraceae bacterium]|nr:mitochondrial fission ELM1 family protein [Caulobacteraceae bacterium]
MSGDPAAAVPGPITAWAVTTGEAGMRSQARGLARAVADAVVEKTVRVAAPWRWAPPALVARPLSRLDRRADALAPPWPDLMVTCGRRSAALGLAVRRESGGRTVAVHIQDPRLPVADFDLVVALDHDDMPGAANVIATATAMHDVTPAALATAAEAWRIRLGVLGRPLAGVMIGGSTRRRPFGAREADKLIAGLRRLRESGAALAISPSRRTPGPVLSRLAAAFAGDGRVWLWDRAGDNPYLGILALADRLVITGDSVSMVSEAVATASPVEVFDPDSERHERFLDALVARGRVRRFEGDPAPPPVPEPLDATLAVAAVVRRLLRERRTVQESTGVVGKAS